MSNLKIWDQLSKTDPAQTKRFQRSGGFSGTAIKPIWTILRMTEVFGSCGIGWGMEKPEFSTENANEEILVFCTVGVWYVQDGVRGVIYGVGGDKVIVKELRGLRASDEARKMAYTDAIGNAIKFIGVAADVHMGLFDDNKYVKAMEAEISRKELAAAEARTAAAAATIPQKKFISKVQAQQFRDACIAKGIPTERIKEALSRTGIKSSATIPEDEFDELMAWVQEAEAA